MVERERDIIVSRKKMAKRGRKNNGREVKLHYCIESRKRNGKKRKTNGGRKGKGHKK